MDASAPPANTVSTLPDWIAQKASPIALFAVAHALTGAKQGPCNPISMDTTAETMLAISIGAKYGLILLDWDWRRVLWFFSMVAMPPIPVPINAPALLVQDSLGIRPACVTAFSEA